MTHEVLPTIRRTGAYVDPRRVDVADQDAVAAAARDAARVVRELFVEERAKRWEVEQDRERDRPKLLVAEEFFGSHGLMGVRDAARAFGVRGSVLADLLRRWGWLDIRETGAKSYAVEHGYMANKVALTSCGQYVRGKMSRRGIARAACKLVDVPTAHPT